MQFKATIWTLVCATDSADSVQVFGDERSALNAWETALMCYLPERERAHFKGKPCELNEFLRSQHDGCLPDDETCTLTSETVFLSDVEAVQPRRLISDGPYDNADRAETVGSLATIFAQSTGLDPDEEKRESISDLIGNLGHYWAAHDFPQVVAGALAHWHCETFDPSEWDMPRVEITINGHQMGFVPKV